MREVPIKRKQYDKENTIEKNKKNLNKQNGITLIALVVTIVVLLILAAITINLLFSNGGIFDIANQSKIEFEIGAIKDRINNVIADWSIERLTKPGITADDLWDKMVDADIISDPVEDYVKGPEKEGENDVYEVTTNEGYIVEVIVSPDGNVTIGEVAKGDKLPPKIVEVKSSAKTNSIHVEVTMSRWENGTISYYYKKNGEEDTSYKPLKEEVTDLTADFTGLEQNVVYNIKVIAKAENGSTEKVVNEITAELKEGTISQVGETIWSNGTASIELETTEEGVTIQYQIDGIEGEWLDYEGAITGLNHGQTVYAVITDGTNISGHTSIDILDEKEPTVTVTQGSVTSNSIQVNVSANDAEWGMPDTITYNYYIKQTSAGSYPQEATHTGTETSYTFRGLTQGTSYDVKVTVVDKAGNPGEGQVTNITTNTVGGASTDLKEGNIIASEPTWSGGKASITLSKGTGVASNLTIQYQVGATTGNWTTGTEGANSVTVTGLQHGNVVYARITDGNNVGSYASVTILDLIPPSIPIVNSNGYVSDTWTNTNLTFSFSSSDNESGLLKYQWSPDGINIYDITNPYTWTTDTRTGFYVRAVDNVGNYSGWGGGVIIAKDTTPPIEASISLSSTSTTTKESVTATVTHTDYLSGVNATSCRWVYNTTAGKIGTSISNYPNTFNSNGQQISLSTTNPGTYYLHVLTVDNAGNAIETVSSAITVNPVIPTIEETLKAGNYVYYEDGKGITRKCAVLYDNSSGYGIQIITMETVEDFWMGIDADAEADVYNQERNNFFTTYNEYNTAIGTLNTKAEAYINPLYASDARCVGSVPNNKNSEAGIFSSSREEMSGYFVRNQDDNYLTDYNKMVELGIVNLNTVYVLASRVGYFSSRDIDADMRAIDNYGHLIEFSRANSLIGINSTGRLISFAKGYGLRPVFTLKPGLKVTGGNGTSESPYTLST